MNEIHYEEVELLNELDELFTQYEKKISTAEKLDQKLDEFFQHMSAHFKAEEVQMEVIKFPPYPVHKEEHDNLLSVTEKHISDWKETRQLISVSEFIRVELVQWLNQHIATMDKVTAHFFAKAGKEVSLNLS